MLALAATNTVGVLLFATLYAVAGGRLLSQAAFLICLAALVALVTVLWIRVEGRDRSVPLLRRAGRILGGFVVVVVALPALALMPLFWLNSQLPPEAGLRDVLAPAMAILLFSLLMLLAVQVLGIVTIALRPIVVGHPSTPR